MNRLAIHGAGVICAQGLRWRGLARTIGQHGFAPAHALADSHPGTLAAEVTVLPAPAGPDEVRVRGRMARPALLTALATASALDDAAWRRGAAGLGVYLGVGDRGGAMTHIEALRAAAGTQRGAARDADPADAGVADDLSRSDASRDPHAGGQGDTPCADAGRDAAAPAGADAGRDVAAPAGADAGRDVAAPAGADAAVSAGAGAAVPAEPVTLGRGTAFFSRGGGTIRALAEAARAIEAGACRRALAGGADSALHPDTWSEIARRGPIGLVPGEGAGVLALSREAEGAVAFVDHCAVHPGHGSDPTAAPGSIEVTDLLALAALDWPPGDFAWVVIAPWGPAARALLEEWAGTHLPLATLLDTSLGFGDALAAGPALAWLAALDVVATHPDQRALIVSAGIDGDLGVVALSGAEARGRAGPATPP